MYYWFLTGWVEIDGETALPLYTARHNAGNERYVMHVLEWTSYGGPTATPQERSAQETCWNCESPLLTGSLASASIPRHSGPSLPGLRERDRAEGPAALPRPKVWRERTLERGWLEAGGGIAPTAHGHRGAPVLSGARLQKLRG